MSIHPARKLNFKNHLTAGVKFGFVFLKPACDWKAGLTSGSRQPVDETLWIDVRWRHRRRGVRRFVPAGGAHRHELERLFTASRRLVFYWKLNRSKPVSHTIDTLLLPQVSVCVCVLHTVCASSVCL